MEMHNINLEDLVHKAVDANKGTINVEYLSRLLESIVIHLDLERYSVIFAGDRPADTNIIRSSKTIDENIEKTGQILDKTKDTMERVSDRMDQLSRRTHALQKIVDENTRWMTQHLGKQKEPRCCKMLAECGRIYTSPEFVKNLPVEPPKTRSKKKNKDESRSLRPKKIDVAVQEYVVSSHKTVCIERNLEQLCVRMNELEQSTNELKYRNEQLELKLLASDDEDDDKIEDLCCRHENGEDEESLNLSNVTTFSTIERRAKVQHFDELDKSKEPPCNFDAVGYNLFQRVFKSHQLLGELDEPVSIRNFYTFYHFYQKKFGTIHNTLKAHARHMKRNEKSILDLEKKLNTKLNITEFEQFQSDVESKHRLHASRIQKLYEAESEANGITKYVQGAMCASCMLPAKIRETNEPLADPVKGFFRPLKSIKPQLTYALDKVRTENKNLKGTMKPSLIQEALKGIEYTDQLLCATLSDRELARRENAAVEEKLFGKKSKLRPWLKARKITVPSGKIIKAQTDSNILQKDRFSIPKMPQNCFVEDKSPTCAEDGVTRIHQKPDRTLMKDMYHKMWNVNCLEKSEERQYEKRKLNIP